jgi:hypothetical protein
MYRFSPNGDAAYSYLYAGEAIVLTSVHELGPSTMEDIQCHMIQMREELENALPRDDYTIIEFIELLTGNEALLCDFIWDMVAQGYIVPELSTDTPLCS